MDCLKYQPFRGVNVPYYLYYAYFYSYTYFSCKFWHFEWVFDHGEYFFVSYFNGIQHNFVQLMKTYQGI